MRIAICDDDRNILELLSKYIKDTADEIIPQEHVEIETFQSAFALSTFLDVDKETLDIIFLDIVLDKENGIELGAKIQERQKNVKIIFITGYIGYVEDIFNIVPFSLLLKPITIDKVRQVLKKAGAVVLAEKAKYVTFKNKDGISTVDLNDISFIESSGRYLNIYLESRENIRIIMTMDEIAEELDEQFVKCHRSYYVNVNKIKRISKKVLNVGEDIEVPISQKNYQIVYDKFMKMLEA